MINSLYKDSHITQSLYLSKNQIKQRECSERRTSKSRVAEYSSVTVNNNIGINVRKPAEISFCGSFNPIATAKNMEEETLSLSKHLKLLTPDFCKVREGAKKFFLQDNVMLTKKDLNEKVIALFEETINFLGKQTSEVSERTKTFINTDDNKESLLRVIKHSEELVQPKAPEKQRLKGKALFDAIHSLTAEANNILAFVEKTGENSLLKDDKKWLLKLLAKAADNQIVFSSLFALFLTCTLRPISIVALPGQKKNKDDKKYAAAHSIASGVIGYFTALLIASPIAIALKKIGKAPTKYLDIKSLNYYLGDDQIDYLQNIKEKLAKEVKERKLTQKRADAEFIEKSTKQFKAAKFFNNGKKIINMAPDTILAIPKAILTIALIPPILKYIFGLEKKKHETVKKVSETSIDKKDKILNQNNTDTLQTSKNIKGGVR